MLLSCTDILEIKIQSCWNANNWEQQASSFRAFLAKHDPCLLPNARTGAVGEKQKKSKFPEFGKSKTGLLVISISQVVSATSDGHTTVHSSMEPAIRQWGSSEIFLQQGRLLQLSRLLQIPKMEKKQSVCHYPVLKCYWKIWASMYFLNLAANIGRNLVVEKNGEQNHMDIPT